MKYVYIQLYNSYRNYFTKFLKCTQFTRYTCFNIFLNTIKDSYTSLISKSLLCFIIPRGNCLSALFYFLAKYKLKWF